MKEQAPQDPINFTTYRPHASQSVCPPSLVSLQACITDLERDWDVRSHSFWQHVLHTLQSLQGVLTTRIVCMTDRGDCNSLYLIQEHIDEVGLLITAHDKARRTPL